MLFTKQQRNLLYSVFILLSHVLRLPQCGEDSPIMAGQEQECAGPCTSWEIPDTIRGLCVVVHSVENTQKEILDAQRVYLSCVAKIMSSIIRRRHTDGGAFKDMHRFVTSLSNWFPSQPPVIRFQFVSRNATVEECLHTMSVDMVRDIIVSWRVLCDRELQQHTNQ